MKINYTCKRDYLGKFNNGLIAIECHTEENCEKIIKICHKRFGIKTANGRLEWGSGNKHTRLACITKYGKIDKIISVSPSSGHFANYGHIPTVQIEEVLK